MTATITETTTVVRSIPLPSPALFPRPVVVVPTQRQPVLVRDTKAPVVKTVRFDIIETELDRMSALLDLTPDELVALGTWCINHLTTPLPNDAPHNKLVNVGIAIKQANLLIAKRSKSELVKRPKVVQTQSRPLPVRKVGDTTKKSQAHAAARAMRVAAGGPIKPAAKPEPKKGQNKKGSKKQK